MFGLNQIKYYLLLFILAAIGLPPLICCYAPRYDRWIEFSKPIEAKGKYFRWMEEGGFLS
jgi:hypothetical protein